MLVAVALLAFAFRLLVLFIDMRFDSGIWPPVFYFGFFVAGGAAFGCVEGRPFTWALFGGFYRLGTALPVAEFSS